MEQTTYKAERRTIHLGDIPLEVAMLPNGDYCLSQTQVAKAIDKAPRSIFEFIRSKYFKVNWSKACELLNFPPIVALEGVNKPIKPIPVKVACLYWQKWAVAGNEKAQQLSLALVKHSIYELSDREFGIHRTDQARNQALKEDLHEDKINYLESLEEYKDFLQVNPPETDAERELKLKIELARLELEKEKIQHSLGESSYQPGEIKKLGSYKPEVLIYLKDRLKLNSWSEAERFMEKHNFGRESGEWIPIKISGEILILPWASVRRLQGICTQFKARQN